MSQLMFMGGMPTNIWLVLAVIWTLAWKGTALYKSARNDQLGWFLVLLLINTLGILEMIYLRFFQKDRNIN